MPRTEILVREDGLSFEALGSSHDSLTFAQTRF